MISREVAVSGQTDPSAVGDEDAAISRATTITADSNKHRILAFKTLFRCGTGTIIPSTLVFTKNNFIKIRLSLFHQIEK